MVKWRWRRMEISRTDHVRNEVLVRVKEQRNILHEISKGKANWIGHILRRNCPLQRVIEWKIKEGTEVTGRRGKRRRKLLDDLRERRGYSHLKEEVLDRTMWTAHFGRGFGPVVRQTAKWMSVMRVRHDQTCSMPFLHSKYVVVFDANLLINCLNATDVFCLAGYKTTVQSSMHS